MRILQVAHFLPPLHVAGVEVYTDRLATRLAEEHDVAVLFSEIRRREPSHTLRRHARGRVHAYEVTNNRLFRSFEQSYDDPALQPVIAQVLDEFEPDVVHIQHLMGLSAAVLTELARRGVPTVMTLHDHWLECAEGGQRLHRDLGRCEVLDAQRCGACTAHMSGPALRARALLAGRLDTGAGVARSAREGTPRGIDLATQWLKRVYKAGSRLASVPTAVQARRIEQRWALLRTRVSSLDKLLVPSRYLAQALIEFGLPADRIAHLPYGFEATRFGKRPQPLPSTARHFAFLGSVVPHKGVHVLLEAFAGQPASARLDLCGSLQSAPDYVANLQQRWRHPGIRFLGELDNDRIPGFLAQVDCLVVPSIWHENAPLVIREAHLAGLPVVASRLGGHVEMLEHGGGLLYDADSSDALANCLRRLAEEPGLLAALAQTAPPVESLESHIAELVELYSGLLRAH